MEKNLPQSSVAKQFGWDLAFMERMEMGIVPMDHFWRVVKLLKFYGKKLRFDLDNNLPSVQ